MAIFTAEITSGRRIAQRQIANDIMIHDLEKEGAFDISNIYFLTKSRRVRYNVKETRLIYKAFWEFRIALRIGSNIDTEYHVRPYDCWPQLHGKFTNEDQFNSVFCSYEIHSDSNDFVIWITVFQEEHSVICTLPIPIERIVGLPQLDLGTPPEVVYIGQSFDIRTRIGTHSKIIKILSELSDDEEMSVNLLTFKIGVGGTDWRVLEHLWNFFLMSDTPFGTNYSAKREISLNEYRVKVSLTEALLINFLKPVYNANFVNIPNLDQRLIKENLLNKGVISIVVSFAMHGPQWQFWSPNQIANTDTFRFSFSG